MLGYLLALFLSCILAVAPLVTAEDGHFSAAEIETETKSEQQHYAMLYPWVVEAFGIIVFLLCADAKQMARACWEEPCPSMLPCYFCWDPQWELVPAIRT